MPDPAVPAPAPAPSHVAPPPAAAVAARDAARNSARAGRRATAMAKIQASTTGAAAATAPAPKPDPENAAAPADPKQPEPTVAKDAPKADPKSAPAPAADDKPDPATERGLRAVETARKKFLDEQNAAKAELEVQRAEIARLRKDAEGKVGSIEELKKFKPSEILDRLALDDDGNDAMARHAYARTKTGKADPRAAAAVQEAERSQASREHGDALTKALARIDELEGKLTGEFKRRDQMVIAEKWLGDATKSIPTDKPTLIGKLMEKSPESARAQLLAIGQALEKANDGEQPTHAEVIEEFEKGRRAALEEQGVDVDALLAPKKAASTPAQRTLDVRATQITRTEHAPQTRDERRAIAQANLKARQRQTADQA